MTDYVAIPRRVAVNLATTEARSLRARAKGSPRCTPQWLQAAAKADEVADGLAEHSDSQALKAALAVAPLWRRAADCEGVPSMGNYYSAVGEDPAGSPTLADLQAEFRSGFERLTSQEKEQLRWRKYATYATIAGALFAAIRLTDIWLAVRARRRSEEK